MIHTIEPKPRPLHMTRRIGMAGYVRILAMLRDEPRTVRELADTGIVGRTGAGRIIGSLHHLRVLRIVGWRQRPGCRTQPMYGISKAEDAPAPALRPNGRPVEPLKPRKVLLSTEVVALVSLMRALEDPMSKAELMQATGLWLGGLRPVLAALRRHGFVRIALWVHPAHGPVVPHFQLGSGYDASRPPRITRSETNRRYMARRQEAKKYRALQHAFCAIAVHGEQTA
jgi:hypothetical protein